MVAQNISTEEVLDNFIAKVKHYYPTDATKIGEAFDLAKRAHEGQFRSSGRAYFTHPTTVADILIDMGLDVSTICAALLHDTVEDTSVTDQDLVDQFGVEIANLVAGVTKLDKLKFNSKEQEQAENMRKMFFAMAKDIRVMLIKLADRLHNMRELQYLAPAKQQRIAKETLDIFAPIAGRLGISQVKCELEDLCLKYLDREQYDFLSSNISQKKQERQDIVDDFMMQIRNELGGVGIVDFDISGRTKHFYSIYKKMTRQGKTLEQIYDMTAVRIIVDSVKDCYAVLGAIHAKWRPMQGRFKDYIAVPKPNRYQSLHTTVISQEGNINWTFEVQIRTHEMHKIAEYGIAAHWKYKEGITSATPMDSNLGWVKEVLYYDTELKNNTEFLDIIRKDISNTNEVYVFTPNGDVKSLTAGATALDFAYSIHSQVGNRCVGTKINGKIVPLDTIVSTGDVIEVMTNPNSKGPSRDWLKIVKTGSAKAKIRQFFKRELKDEFIKTGRSMIEREAKHRSIVASDLLTSEAIAGVCQKYFFNDADEIYASVGYGSMSLQQVMSRLIACNSNITEQMRVQRVNKHKNNTKSKENAIIIKGMDDLMIRFAKCCNPVPGDEIIGFISRGRGVVVHRHDCHAVKSMEHERLVEASWASMATTATFPATIQIVADDKGDIFADITKAIVNERLPISSINARKDKKGNAVALVTVEISNHDQVNSLIVKLKTIPNIINVFRTNS